MACEAKQLDPKNRVRASASETTPDHSVFVYVEPLLRGESLIERKAAVVRDASSQ
jgi:hypothetical protein